MGPQQRARPDHLLRDLVGAVLVHQPVGSTSDGHEHRLDRPQRSALAAEADGLLLFVRLVGGHLSVAAPLPVAGERDDLVDGHGDGRVAARGGEPHPAGSGS